jgi:hypothetical protein
MDIKLDRREILPMMKALFPSLSEKATSDEVHAFLDAKTGCTTPLEEPNSTAFDRWRKELAHQNYPTWDFSERRSTEVAIMGLRLLIKEQEREAALPSLLEELAKAAPGTPLENP